MAEDKTALVLANLGFKPSPLITSFPTYLGILKTARGDLAARLELRTPFHAPKLFLTEKGRENLNRPVYPHTLSSGFVCVFEEAMHDIDPFKAGGHLKGFLDHSINVLSITSEKDIEKEIASDLANHFEGHIQHVSAKNDTYLKYQPLTEGSETSGFFPTDSHLADGIFIKTGSLSFSSDEHLPETLKDFYTWLKKWDPDAWKRLNKQLDSCTSLNLAFTIFLGTPGGVVGIRLGATSIGPKEREPFSKRTAARFMRNPLLTVRKCSRLTGIPAQIDELLHRNSTQFDSLAGKKVVLVGCGAIGSHLAFLLVQNGAGLGKGRLLIVDHDTLSIPNTLRHRLGAQHTGKNKAKAVRDELIISFPSANTHFAANIVSAVMDEIAAADIVIDATGELSVREELNQWAIECEPTDDQSILLQHSWIEGNGAACFSFFHNPPKGACGRCVFGRYHTDKPRYHTIRTQDQYDGVVCGGSVYAPYGPQASIMAASLAMQHLIETINGVAHGTFRTLQIDLDNSKYTKPSTPKALKDCPACQPNK